MTHTSTPDTSHSFSLREFLHGESSGGVLLLLSVVIALLWANSPWGASYDALWATELTLGLVQVNLTESLRHWINDGLMAIFFLVVGLEIKREVLVGELASPRRALLPAIAALGGALAPAAIYTVMNRGTEGAAGWGIPMATDIAFALGVLALLGDRIPVGLKVFLAALAIADDLLAVLVIAVFYTARLDIQALLLAATIMGLLILANRLRVRQPLVYGLLGVALWGAVYQSGVHATVAGVLLAMTIPARTRIDPEAFVTKGRRLLSDFERGGETGASVLTSGARQEALAELEDVVEAAGAPLQRMEHTLHPWVTYAIVPLFALANAGVRIEGEVQQLWTNQVTLGVVLGLVLGKQLGVTLGAWLAIRTGLTELPEGTTWRQIYGVGWLAGIGFTMALFVADLAFPGAQDASLLSAAKLGILIASIVAGIGGWIILRQGANGPHRAK